MRGPQSNTRQRSLRSNQTEAERVLWQHLRDRRLLGYKFRRQHRIDRFYPDFICLQAHLIVELDGSQHLQQQGYDDSRTESLRQHGFRVMRLWNNDVLLRIDDALAVIAAALVAPHPAFGHPLPACGERESNGAAADIALPAVRENESSAEAIDRFLPSGVEKT